MARVIFITGFHRSGTTLLAAALTEAAGATTLTAGDLARHIPAVDELLTSTKDNATDRGVDRLPVTASTPEEYCWLLRVATGKFEFGPEAAESGVLQKEIEQIAADGDDPVVVLKNPWDTGQEQFLLDTFPDSKVVIIRRGITATEESVERSWVRMAESSAYPRALMGDPMLGERMMMVFSNPELRARMGKETREGNRRKVSELAASVENLPLDRVAFVSYDELRDDAKAGARWAAHVVDPERLAKAFSTLTFPEYNTASAGDEEAERLDAEWAEGWRRARAKQVEAGILPGND